MQGINCTAFSNTYDKARFRGRSRIFGKGDDKVEMVDWPLDFKD